MRGTTCRKLATLVLCGAVFGACGDEATKEDTSNVVQYDATVDADHPDTGPDAAVDLAVDLQADLGLDLKETPPDAPPDLGIDLPPKPDSDVTGPAVKSTDPTSNQTQVVLSTKVSAVFTEPIAPATITTASFLLDLGSVSIPGATSAVGDTATFTPTWPLCPLRKYDATLKKTITDLASNPLAADYAWSFTTGDGSWSTPTKAPTDSYGARVTIAENGDVFVIWEASTPTDLYARRYDSATGQWDAATPIDGATTDVSSGDIAADAAGNAIAVWRQASSADLYGARFDASTKTWSTPVALETAAGSIGSPRVAMSPTGTAMVVFTQDITTTTSAAYYNYFNGATWSGRTPIPVSGVRPYLYVRVAGDGLGSFFATWTDRIASGNYTLRANRFDKTSTSWGTTIALAANLSSDYHQLTAGPAGAFAIWRYRPQTTYIIAAARFSGTTWGTPAALSSALSTYPYGPVIAMDLAGNALAAWSENAVRYSHYAVGTSTWSASATASATGDDPGVTMDAAGNGFLLWGENVTGGERLQGARWLGATKTLQTAAWVAPARQGYLWDGIPIAANACGQAALVCVYANEGPYDPPDIVLFR